MSTSETTNFVKNWLLDKIQKGELEPGEVIPTEFELKRTLDIEYEEIEKAIHELVTEQILSHVTSS